MFGPVRSPEIIPADVAAAADAQRNWEAGAYEAGMNILAAMRTARVEKMAKAIVRASWDPNPMPEPDVEAIWQAVTEPERANALRLAEAAYDAL